MALGVAVVALVVAMVELPVSVVDTEVVGTVISAKKYFKVPFSGHKDNYCFDRL